MTVPRATTMLRLIVFTVPAVLCLAGVQPLLAAATGQVTAAWAINLSVPAIIAALVFFLAARVLDRGDSVAPPWYSAWVLMPGAFVLCGAAAMCLIGSLVEFAGITSAMWFLLAGGAPLWSGGLILVRQTSH